MRYAFVGIVFAIASVLSGRLWAGDGDLYVFPQVTVSSERELPAQGSSVLDRETLDRRPGSHREGNEALRTVPGVQFSDSATSSDQGGEIAPARIAISGGRTYENAFSVDGMPASSLLDPDSNAKPNNPSALPGHPQIFFFSPELMDRITVHTHNISARHGGFTGGVVDAQLRHPDLHPWGKVKYWTSRSAWTSLHSDDPGFSSSSSSALQPGFDRHDLDVMANFPVTEANALLGAFSMRHSTIPLDLENNPDEETRSSLNALIKWRRLLDDGGQIHVTALTAPYSSANYISKQLDSEIVLAGLPWQFQVGRDWDLPEAKIEVRLGYQRYETEREARSTFRQWLNTPSKSWGGDEKYSLEGGYGDLRMSQDTIVGTLDLEKTAFEFAGMRHRIGAGLALEGMRGVFERPETAYVYYSPVASKTVRDPSDLYADSVMGEQYFSRRSVYDADRVSATMNTVAAYVEDEWSVHGLTLRPGVRLSHDDFLGNLNLAPRLAAQYDLFGDSNTLFLGGLNRYYGQALMTYKLREARKELRRETRKADRSGLVYPETGDSDGYWIVGDPSSSNYRYSSLDTPYSDEAVVGIEHHLLWGEWDWGTFSVRVVNRWYEDEFARERIDDADGERRFVLNNNGSSSYRGVTGTWIKGWENHRLELNLTVQETVTSHDTYDQSLDDEALDAQVWFDGSLMDRIDLPRTDYNRPWLANLIYTANLSGNLFFTNITRARAGYSAIVDAKRTVSIDGAAYPVYEKVRRDPVFTFDWKLAWERPIRGGHVLTLGLEVLNVFDARIPVADSSTSYEMGRQFWAGVEYRF